MSDRSQSSLFEPALQDYERQTGTELVKHPLAERLEDCHSVESVVIVLQEQVQVIGDLQGGDDDGGRIMKSLHSAVLFLHTLSTSIPVGDAVGLVRLKARMRVSCL